MSRPSSSTAAGAVPACEQKERLKLNRRAQASLTGGVFEVLHQVLRDRDEIRARERWQTLENTTMASTESEEQDDGQHSNKLTLRASSNSFALRQSSLDFFFSTSADFSFKIADIGRFVCAMLTKATVSDLLRIHR
jgi:hypothetical protein